MSRMIPCFFAALLGLCAASAQAEESAAAALFAPTSLELALLDTDDTALGHQPRKRAGEKRPGAGAWFGIGAGILNGSVDHNNCGSGDCSESGLFGTYTANFTVAGPVAFRIRGIRTRDQDGNDSTGRPRTAYEVAALVGGRFGNSPWYGMIGTGRVHYADDDVPETTRGFAWEFLFAPRSQGPAGFELSFHGHHGNHVDFVGFGLGMRFGALP